MQKMVSASKVRSFLAARSVYFGPTDMTALAFHLKVVHTEVSCPRAAGQTSFQTWISHGAVTL